MSGKAHQAPGKSQKQPVKVYVPTDGRIETMGTISTLERVHIGVDVLACIKDIAEASEVAGDIYVDALVKPYPAGGTNCPLQIEDREDVEGLNIGLMRQRIQQAGGSSHRDAVVSRGAARPTTPITQPAPTSSSMDTTTTPTMPGIPTQFAIFEGHAALAQRFENLLERLRTDIALNDHDTAAYAHDVIDDGINPVNDPAAFRQRYENIVSGISDTRLVVSLETYLTLLEMHEDEFRVLILEDVANMAPSPTEQETARLRAADDDSGIMQFPESVAEVAPEPVTAPIVEAAAPPVEEPAAKPAATTISAKSAAKKAPAKSAAKPAAKKSPAKAPAKLAEETPEPEGEEVPEPASAAAAS